MAQWSCGRVRRDRRTEVKGSRVPVPGRREAGCAVGGASAPTAKFSLRIQARRHRHATKCLRTLELSRFRQSTPRRPPGCSGSCRADHPDGNRAGRSPCHLPDNPESRPGNCLLDHLAGHPPENLLRHRADHPDRSPAGPRAGCPENHLEDSPAGNLQSDGPGCPVGSPVSHLHGNPAGVCE